MAFSQRIFSRAQDQFGALQKRYSQQSIEQHVGLWSALIGLLSLFLPWVHFTSGRTAVHHSALNSPLWAMGLVLFGIQIALLWRFWRMLNSQPVRPSWLGRAHVLQQSGGLGLLLILLMSLSFLSFPDIIGTPDLRFGLFLCGLSQLFLLASGWLQTRTSLSFS